ncbi:UNVERIFIED_CONTAM: hypothetical protein FKN15_030986 [Acipenser sinensis]
MRKTIKVPKMFTISIDPKEWQNIAPLKESSGSVILIIKTGQVTFSHYTLGVILTGTRQTVARQRLPKVRFDEYDAAIGFYNQSSHWKLVMAAVILEEFPEIPSFISMLSTKVATDNVRNEMAERILEASDEDVFRLGCQKTVSNRHVLKNLAAEHRKSERFDQDEVKSLLKMIKPIDDENILQKIPMEPPSAMLWSASGLQIYHQRCKQDIVYLGATGSIITTKKKREHSRFYIYELVVWHPNKNKSPIAVASYVTTDHSMPSIQFFLGSFLLSECRLYGYSNTATPRLIICDSSLLYVT